MNDNFREATLMCLGIALGIALISTANIVVTILTIFSIGTILASLHGRRGSLAYMLNSLLPVVVAIDLGEAPALPPRAWRRREPARGRPPGWAGGVGSRSRLAEAAAGSACVALRAVG